MNRLIKSRENSRDGMSSQGSSRPVVSSLVASRRVRAIQVKGKLESRPIRPGLIATGHVKSGLVKSYQCKSRENSRLVMSGQVPSLYVASCRFWSMQVKVLMKIETAVETKMAYIELKKLGVGEVCSYEQLKKAIDCDPQGDGYGYVKSARERLERELECVFEAIPNEGIKRSTAREVINRGGRDIAHIRRSVNRGFRRQSTLVPIADSEDLTQEERTKFFAQVSLLGAMRLATKPRVVDQLEKAVVSASMPAREVLQLAAAPRPVRSAPKVGQMQD